MSTTDYNEYNRKVPASEQILVDAACGNPGGMVLTVTSAQGLAGPRAQTPTKLANPGEYNYAELENPTGLVISFTRATGIFKGAFNMYYDYISTDDQTTDKQTWSHITKKLQYEGILTPEREDLSDGIGGRGFYLWPDKGECPNPQGKLVPYTFNWSYDFIVQSGE